MSLLSQAGQSAHGTARHPCRGSSAVPGPGIGEWWWWWMALAMPNHVGRDGAQHDSHSVACTCCTASRIPSRRVCAAFVVAP